MPPMNRPRALAVFLTILGALGIAAAKAQPSFDVLIQNGRVMDGSGNP